MRMSYACCRDMRCNKLVHHSHIRKSSLNSRFENRVAASRANYEISLNFLSKFTFPIVGIARRVSHIPVNYVYPKVRLIKIYIDHQIIAFNINNISNNIIRCLPYRPLCKILTNNVFNFFCNF